MWKDLWPGTIDERLSAVQTADCMPRVHFRLFFPEGFTHNIESIRVASTFQSEIGSDVASLEHPIFVVLPCQVEQSGTELYRETLVVLHDMFQTPNERAIDFAPV